MLTLSAPSMSHPLVVGAQTPSVIVPHPVTGQPMVMPAATGRPVYTPSPIPVPAVAPAAPVPPASAQDISAVVAALQAIGVDITKLNQNQLGARRQDRGKLDDYAPKPLQITFNVNNKAGVNAGTITAYIFNEDFLLSTPTDNGSGAGSVVETYSDGFNGALLNQIAQAYGIEGIPVKQIQMVAVDNATGQQDKAALLLTNPRKITYNGDQTQATQFIPITSTGDPIYNQTGFLIIDIETRIRRFEQFAETIEVGKTVTTIFVMG